MVFFFLLFFWSSIFIDKWQVFNTKAMYDLDESFLLKADEWNDAVKTAPKLPGELQEIRYKNDIVINFHVHVTYVNVMIKLSQ